MIIYPRLAELRERWREMATPRGALAFPRGARAWRKLLALVVAIANIVVLLVPSLEVYARGADPDLDQAAAPTAYQVTLNIGAGTQYSLYQGAKVDMPVSISVTGGIKLASATVLVQYDPQELRPASCVRAIGGPGGYCNIAWDAANGLVRFNILAPEGVEGGNLAVFTLSFEPAPTSTINRTSSVTPMLDSISDVFGNYMTSFLQGSTVKVLRSTTSGTAVYVGGVSGSNPILIVRGQTVTVPVEIASVTSLGSASFSLSFDPNVVHPLECHAVQLTAASGTCALHADHISANLMSAPPGLSGTVKAFEVVFTTGPTAVAGASSPLSLTLGAFADTNGVPIQPVRVYDNSLKVDKAASGVVPVLRISPIEQYLTGDAVVSVDLYLDNGNALVTGSWGISYDPLVLQAQSCSLYANGTCNATGSPGAPSEGLVRMSVLRTYNSDPFPSKLGTVTFRRHPQAKATQRATLAFAVTNFADGSDAQLAYQTQSATVIIADTLSGAAVAMNLVGVPPYNLAHGDFHDFPIRFVINSAQPIVNLSGSIHYDPKVLRPTRCLRSDSGAGPSGYCNSETDQALGIIRFNLLADSEQGFSGDMTPFVFRMEPASIAKMGDNSALHFTVEAITGPGGVPRTWSAVDEAVSVKTPVDAPRVTVGPPSLTATAVYDVRMGSTTTVPIWVDNVPNLGAGTVEIRYDSNVVRATSCKISSDVTPALSGGFCSLLPGAVRAAFVSAGGIDGDAQVFEIVFAQAPNVAGGERTTAIVVVDNFVDTGEVPIPTTTKPGDIPILCHAQPVNDLVIARSGNNLTLTWTHLGTATSGYQVWRANENAYFAFGDTNATNLGTIAAPVGLPGAAMTYIDSAGFMDPVAGAIGPWADNLNHYYMVRSMCRADQGSLRSNRVGKFTRPIGLAMNLVSLPLLPYSNRIQDIVGTQLTGASSELYADRVWVFDTARQDYSYSWLIAGVAPQFDGRWWDGAAWQESTILLPPNVGFWIQNRQNKVQMLKVVGAVAEPNTQALQLVENMQLIGQAYPIELSLQAATFKEDGAHGASSELYADRIWYFDESLQDYRYAWLISGVGPQYDGKWWDGASWSESQTRLDPGTGYWYQRRGAGNFTWTNPGPMP